MEPFAQLLYQLHLSYLQARKNKRNTQNQIGFEINQEENLAQLATAIYNRTYIPKPSIAFIIQKPVMREIFAADFSDRVVHHLIYRCIYPFIDNKLINDTYSCRKSKGTLYGINRIKQFIGSCTSNYKQDAYILKLDIQAYFMNMQHQLLYDKVLGLLPKDKTIFLGLDKTTVLYLLQQTIFNDVTEDCRIKGKRSDWDNLPSSKSLFHYNPNTGLPIGNLTSQVFGNVYLNDLDQCIKRKLHIKYYGRYVDDMIFVHQDKIFLQSIIPIIQDELARIGLLIHPNKIVLEKADKGVLFLGQFLKPYRTYIGNRTKNNFYQAILQINKMLAEKPQFSWNELCKTRAVLNSYLGTLSHTNTFLLRQKMLGRLINRFHDFFFTAKNLTKVIINKDFWEWHFSPTYRFIN
ncbi:MAG: RNA-directed DNA polymerase [Prolixibacteraceae bacterium]